MGIPIARASAIAGDIIPLASKVGVGWILNLRDSPRQSSSHPALIASAALTLALASCGGAGRETVPAGVPPDVLLVTIDTLRADHLGCYGHARPTSPNIDRIAAEGARFAVAYAPVGATGPSHATLLTGRHVLAHGVVRNGLALGEESVTLAEIFAREGFRTGAFVSSYPVGSRFGYAQGFGRFDEDFRDEGETFPEDDWEGAAVEGAFDRRGGATVEACLAWVEEEAAERPLFLWVHLFDPHAPYAAPLEHAGAFQKPGMDERERLIAAYDEEIRYADAELGRLLAGLERLRPGRSQLLCVTSDHGEGLGARGWLYHNRTTYEEEVRVPLLFRWPGYVPAGIAHPQHAHLVDVAPTILSLLGLRGRAAAPLQGLDLAPALLAASPPPPRPRSLFLQRPYYHGGRPEIVPGERGLGLGLRNGGWKYFEAPEEESAELYDLGSDPSERTNLAAEEPDTARQLSELLATWKERQLAAGAPALEREVPADALPGLKALGYAGEGEER